MNKDIEEKIINSFIVKIKKDRAKFMLWNNYKKRQDFIWNIPYKGIIDERFIFPILDHICNSENVYNILKKYNPPKECYVMSSASLNDGKIIPLKKALENEVFRGPTLISCIHGKLAYVEGEQGPVGLGTAPDRFLLIRDL